MSSARLAVVTRNQTSGNTPTARTVDEGKAGDRISGEGYGDEKPAPPTTVPMSSPVAEPVGVTSSSGAAGAKPAQRSSAAKCGRRLRRTRRAIKSGWRRLFDILYWVIDTLRVWDISAGSGISSSGRPKASCKERLFRWVFALGAACWASLLFVWNSTYFNPSYPVQFGKLGIACGVLAGLIRPICFHNRWLCYRRVPRRDGRTRLVNVSSNKQGMADVVAGAMDSAGLSPTAALTPEQMAAKREAAKKAAIARIGKMSAADRQPAGSLLQVLCSCCFTKRAKRLWTALIGHTLRDFFPIFLVVLVPFVVVGVIAANVKTIAHVDKQSDNWIIVQTIFVDAMLASLATFVVIYCAMIHKHFPARNERYIGVTILYQAVIGASLGFCLAGWAAAYGLLLGFTNGMFLRYIRDNLILTIIGALLSLGTCCCIPIALLYRWLKTIRSPEISVVTMDLIEREEANKNPNRGLGGIRSPNGTPGIDRDDDPKDLDPFKRKRPDDIRKKWGNNNLQFDDFLDADKQYVVQQGKRRHVRLASVVAQAKRLQKDVIANDDRRVTIAKLHEMARVCASALLHGNLDNAKRLLESGCPPNSIIDHAPLLVHAVLGRYSAPAVKLLLKHGATVADPFTRLVRDKERLASAQVKNAARFDDDMNTEVDDDTPLSMTVETGGYASATKDHLAKILGNTEPVKYRDDVTCFAPLHYACMTGDEKVVIALLQAGADPNIRTFVEQKTPMQLAIQYGRNVIVRRLLTYVGLARLDVHGKDVHGRNVIDELEDMYWNGLVDSGATIGEDADATGTTSVDGETAGGASGTASVDGRGSRASTTSGPSTRKSSRVQDGVAVSDSRKSSRAQDVGASTPVAAKQSKSQAVSSVVKSTSSPAARTGTPGAAVVSQKDSPMVKTRGSVSFAVAGASAGAGTADNDDEETLSTSTTNAKPVKMSMVQRLREEVEATSADAMAAKTRAEGAERKRKLRKGELLDIKHKRKLQTGNRQLMAEEADRMADIIDVLGQQLGNKGLWIHPDDRAPTPPPVIERRGSHSSSDDAALGPHRGRFKMGQDSSDTDSSDVDSIVVKRDVKRKLKGYSDSEGSGSDDERKPLVRQASTPLAASKPAVTVPADALATTATAATVSKSSKRGSMPLTAGGIQHFNSDEESKFGQEGRVIIRLTETGK